MTVFLFFSLGLNIIPSLAEDAAQSSTPTPAPSTSISPPLTPTATATPLATLNPTIEALTNQLATLQAQLGDQKSNDQKFAELQWQMDKQLWIWGVLGLVFTLLGLGSIVSIQNEVRRKVSDEIRSGIEQAEIDKTVRNTVDVELNLLVPVRVPIYLAHLYGNYKDDTEKDLFNQEIELLAKVRRRLEIAKFERINSDFGLPNRDGIIIVVVNSTDAEEKYRRLYDTFGDSPLSPTQTGIVLYTPGQYRTDHEFKKIYEDTYGKNVPYHQTLEYHENTVTANMPATIVNAVLSVGRGLLPPS